METFAPTVLTGRVLPRSRVAAVVAVIGFAALTAAAAQYRIPLGFTPVPITGSTFAVLLSGAALGMRLGAASQVVYLLMGAVGLPVFTDGGSGIEVITGSTGGYLVGFVFGAALIGKLAECSVYTPGEGTDEGEFVPDPEGFSADMAAIADEMDAVGLGPNVAITMCNSGGRSTQCPLRFLDLVADRGLPACSLEHFLRVPSNRVNSSCSSIYSSNLMM